MDDFFLILGIIFCVISIVSIVLFIYEVKHAPLLPPDVKF